MILVTHHSLCTFVLGLGILDEIDYVSMIHLAPDAEGNSSNEEDDETMMTKTEARVADALECACCLGRLAPGAAVALECGHTYCNRGACASSSVSSGGLNFASTFCSAFPPDCTPGLVSSSPPAHTGRPRTSCTR